MSLKALTPLDWFEVRSHSRCPQLRVGHSSLFVPSLSQVFIVGGANPSECFADIQSLSIPKGPDDPFNWTILVGEDEKLRRYEHSTVHSSLDGEKIVFFGGANLDGNRQDVQAFDLTTKSIEDWTPKDNPFVSARTHHSSCLIQKGLYIFSGGLEGAKAVDDTDLYRFDLERKTWSIVDVHGIPPEQRHGHCLLSLSDRFLFLHGGMDGRTFFSSLYSIDINEKPARWREICKSTTNSSFPVSRAAHGGVSLEETSSLVIFGGLSRAGQALNDVWSWSNETQQWTELICRSSPKARLDFAYCLIRLKLDENNSNDETSCLFVHGGTDTDGQVFDDCFLLRLTFPNEKDSSNKVH